MHRDQPLKLGIGAVYGEVLAALPKRPAHDLVQLGSRYWLQQPAVYSMGQDLRGVFSQGIAASGERL